MHPGEIHTLEDLSRALDVARRRAARGSGRGRISLTDLARRTGIPRSTVHVYLSGRTLPPADALDAVLQALDVPTDELGTWADALERVAAPVAAVTEPVETVAPGTVPVPHQLPAARRGFVGRTPELTRLDELSAVAADDPAPLVAAICGFGGVGKTTLASTWAARHVDDFPDGQLWIDLHGYGLQTPVTPSAALGRLLRACGVDTSQLPADAESRADLFRSTVAGKRLLLVLDNAVDSAHVRPLLVGAPGCVVIVTSRSDLRSLVADTGAERLQLAPLDVAAGRLVLAPTAPAGLSVAVTDRLVRHSSGLPLALRILAERIAGRSAADVESFADDLDDREARLAALEMVDGRDGYGLRTVLQSSYAALTDDVAATLRVLPLCLGQDVRTEFVAVCTNQTPAETRRRLDSLVAGSLLQHAGHQRYALVDLVATFADELRQADGPDASSSADRRLAAHLARRYRDAADAVGPTWDAFAPLFPPDATAGGDHGFAGRAAAVAWAQDTVDLAAAVAGRALDRDEVDAAWEVAGHLAHLLCTKADLTALVEVLRPVAAAFEHAGRLRDAADVWRAVGAVQLPQDLRGAGEAYERSRRCAVAAGAVVLADVGTRNVAFVELVHGRPTHALPVLTDLERRFADRGDPLPAAIATLLTTAYLMVGDLDEAERRAHAARRIARAERDVFTETGVSRDLAFIAEERGLVDVEALETIRRDTSDGSFSTRTGACVVRSLVVLGRLDEATADLLAVRRGHGGVPGFDDLVLERAEAALLLARGDAGGAVGMLRETLRRAERWSLAWDVALTLLDLADAYATAGDASAATAAAGRAARLCHDHGFARRARQAEALLAVATTAHTA